MAEPESVGVSSDRLNRLTDTMQRYIDSDKLAGTVSLVSRKGKVIHLESQGYKSKETREAMTEDTIFFIMSMTKPIVSTALMMLYEEGHFLLTDPISDWIPELAGKQVIMENEYGELTHPVVKAFTVGTERSMHRVVGRDKEAHTEKRTKRDGQRNPDQVGPGQLNPA